MGIQPYHWRRVRCFLLPDGSSLPKRFGARIRELRRARGLSREALAGLIGVEKATVARIERGERFNASNLAPLAIALQVEVRDLFDFGTGPTARSADLVAAIAFMEERARRDPRFPSLVLRLLRAITEE